MKLKYAIINDKNAVFHCKHAFNLDHICTFAVCNRCKCKADDANEVMDGGMIKTRRALKFTSYQKNNDPNGHKAAMTKRYDNTANKTKYHTPMCHHVKGDYNELEMYSDTSYFEPGYLLKMKTHKKSFPLRCHDCGLEFRKI